MMMAFPIRKLKHAFGKKGNYFLKYRPIDLIETLEQLFFSVALNIFNITEKFTVFFKYAL